MIKSILKFGLIFSLLFTTVTFVVAQDADMDGVLDDVDLDDDNDGILDEVENPCLLVYDFNISSEGWYTINNNDNAQVGSNPASHSTDLLTGNINCPIVITGAANSNIAGASPTGTEYIVDADPTGGITFIRTASLGGMDFSNFIGGEFKYDHYNYRVGFVGDPGWLPNGGSFPNGARGEVFIYGTNGNNITTVHPVNQTDWENGIWNSHSLTFDDPTWSGTPAEMAAVLASVDYISIKMEFIGGGNTGNCPDVEYYALDNVGFEALASCDNDTDNDGIPDHLDADSDNDGCPDAIEAAGTFTAADLDVDDELSGGVDAATGIPTVAGAGQATAPAVTAVGPDADGDSIPDSCDPVDDTANDNDNDGIPDIYDLDDDNDGIPDIVECGGALTDPYGATNFITNPNFSTLAAGPFPVAPGDNISGWTSGVPYPDNGVYPMDTRVSQQTGNINYGGIVEQVSFPGDPVFGVPASATYLYSNGNNTGAPFTIWQQTISGLAENTTYVYYAYTSNAIRPSATVVDAPHNGLMQFLVNGSQAGTPFEVYLETQPESGHNGVDLWDRREVYFTTGPGQTSVVLSLEDRRIGDIGDDFVITAVSAREIISCTPIDTDSDGVPDHLDLDSDNDGIHDFIEAGGAPALDADGDGMIDGPVGTNGWPDAVDPTIYVAGVATTPLAITNTDGVDKPDFQDLDSDNDGCSDANEAYDDANADGGDGGQYGNGDPQTLAEGEVNADGEVIAATYDTGIVAAVTDDLVSSACPANPELTVTKTITTPSTVLGGTITYEITVKNTGNVTITDIDVTDDNAAEGPGVVDNIVSLAPGVDSTVTVTQIITAIDITNGYIENSATATGDSPSGTDDVSDVSDAGDEAVETPNGDGTTDGDATNDPTVTTLSNNPIIAEDDAYNATATGGVIGDVTNNDLLNGVAVTDADITIAVDDDGGIGATIDADGNISIPANTPAGTYTVFYNICEKANPLNCDPAKVIITIPNEELKFYSGFSPEGGNQLNNYWRIDGILDYPENEVKIFNRWGNLVYQVKGYDNNTRAWRGQSTEGTIIGEKTVPDGSYFYVVDLGDGSKVRSGYIVIYK